MKVSIESMRYRRIYWVNHFKLIYSMSMSIYKSFVNCNDYFRSFFNTDRPSFFSEVLLIKMYYSQV